jgi:prophage antirepressor-like protein
MKVENWNGYSIRFVEKDGEWWAVLKDVCDALELRTDGVKARLNANHISNGVEIDEIGRPHKFLIIDEFGIYQTIFQSRKPEAKDFQEWTYHMLGELRQATGLEGFQIFRMLDKEHQKEAMSTLKKSLKDAKKTDYIKANRIANKAVYNKYGYPKSLKKADMTPAMLVDREAVLDDTVELMGVNDKFQLGISVSEQIYKKCM